MSPPFLILYSMIIFDTLDELESYKGVIKEIATVIDVMDHSTPYEENVGTYDNPGKDKGIHVVDTFLTSAGGFADYAEDEKVYVEICLEGEEIVSIDGSVYRLSPGRFISYNRVKTIKRGIMYSLPVATKCVRFIF